MLSVYVATPDPIPEPFLGQRAWGIRSEFADDGTHTPILTSLNGIRWETPILTATCKITSDADNHRVPDLLCTCGIRMCKPEYDHPSWKIGTVKAIGPVRCWGKVIEHEEGYRAEHMEMLGPVKIELTCRRQDCQEKVTDVVARSHTMVMDTRPTGQCTYIAHCPQHSLAYDNLFASGPHVAVIMESWLNTTMTADDWLDHVILNLEDRYKVPFWSWHNFEERIQEWM